MTVWYVPESAALAGCDTFFTDGSCAYCVRDGRELLRVDLYSGVVETLFTGQRILTQDRNWGQLYDGNVLFFLAQSGDKGALYRLYLPSLTLDIIADRLPLKSLACSFSYPLTLNHTNPLPEAGDYSLSKNFQNAPVSGIIEETGAFSWNSGGKTDGRNQSSSI